MRKSGKWWVTAAANGGSGDKTAAAAVKASGAVVHFAACFKISTAGGGLVAQGAYGEFFPVDGR